MSCQCETCQNVVDFPGTLSIQTDYLLFLSVQFAENSVSICYVLFRAIVQGPCWPLGRYASNQETLISDT